MGGLAAAERTLQDAHCLPAMFRIAPERLLPLASLLSVAAAALAGAAALLLLTHRRAALRPLLLRAALAGLALAAASAAFRSTRGAGTGTQTAWGWPRAVYTRWVSWETSERRAGVRLRGLAENAVFYGAVAALAASAGLAARRTPPSSGSRPLRSGDRGIA